MHIIYSEQHLQHQPRYELLGGQLVEIADIPARIEWVLTACQKRNLGHVRHADDFGLAPILRIHEKHYVDFLQTAWEEMQASGLSDTTFGSAWPVSGMRTDRPPRKLQARLGFYSSDGCSPIGDGTWGAAYAAAQTAITAMNSVLAGEDGSLALCRPPGHHAASACAGGYCYLNNAAIAAQFALDHGVSRVAILDIDYHHGNGTQTIFYERADVAFASVHADPLDAYPYFLGHADEVGAKEGRGFNHNFPLPLGTDFEAWLGALDQAIAALRTTQPSLLIVSLGVDTYKDDPISNFKLESTDFSTIGSRLAQLELPTLFVMEGGYAVSAIGENVANVLSGYQFTKSKRHTKQPSACKYKEQEEQ